jgi:hypothetical protein
MTKIFAVFTQITAIYVEKVITTLVFQKIANFYPQNCQFLRQKLI